jgi:hypothetical protein
MRLQFAGHCLCKSDLYQHLECTLAGLGLYQGIDRYLRLIDRFHHLEFNPRTRQLDQNWIEVARELLER